MKSVTVSLKKSHQYSQTERLKCLCIRCFTFTQTDEQLVRWSWLHVVNTHLAQVFWTEIHKHCPTTAGSKHRVNNLIYSTNNTGNC